MIRISLTLLILFSLLSCSTLTRKPPPRLAKPNAKNEFASAQKKMAKGQTQLALREFKKIILNYPETDIADDASILAGDLAFKLKDYELAYSFYINVVDSNVFSPLEVKALTSAAKSLLFLGRFDEALALTGKGLRYRNLPEKEKLELNKQKFSILTQLGDRLEAFETLVYLSQHDSDKNNVESYKLKALDFLESNLTDQELKHITNSPKLGELRAYAHFRLGKQYFEQRAFSEAKDHLEDVVKLMPDSDISDTSYSLIKQIDARRKVAPKVIGAVLPLSGKHASIAEKTLMGLQMGLGIYGQEQSEFKLAIIDSEGNPDAARRAVERLVTEDHVIAIVGSLLSRTSVAVASKANELGVPSIALSQKSGITDVGDFVFRNALTSEMQIERLVQIVMEEKGLTKFAILYPNDHYGVEYANLFWDQVLARGGEIVGVQPYANKETDFSDAIARLVGTFYLEDRKDEYELLLQDWLQKQKSITSRVSPPTGLLQPIIDFEAIFIPDSIKPLGQIAPMLAYHDVNGVKLLGTNLWNSSRLIKRGQKFVDGATFVDSLLTSDNEFKLSSFAINFKSIFKFSPSIFEAQGYDAGLLLRQIIASGARSRAEVQEKLMSINSFPGSVGQLSVNNRREFTRPVVHLEVQNNEIIKVK